LIIEVNERFSFETDKWRMKLMRMEEACGHFSRLSLLQNQGENGINE
jgi:hypothetical protein